MKLRPTPVIMVSSLTREGADATIQALMLGAVDFIAKPSGSILAELGNKQNELLVMLQAAASSHQSVTKWGGSRPNGVLCRPKRRRLRLRFSVKENEHPQ